MSTIGASPAVQPEYESNLLVRAWSAFTIWRRSRPFWAGFWTLLAAVELWTIPFLSTLLTNGTLSLKTGGVAGISTIMITPIMVMMGVAMWFAPAYRVFAGVFVLICSLLAMNVSNFGGFVIGTLLGATGGGLAFAWSPQLTPEQEQARERAAAAYRQALSGDATEAPTAPMAGAAVADEQGTASQWQYVPEAPTAPDLPPLAPYVPAPYVPERDSAMQSSAEQQHDRPLLAEPLNARAATDADVPPPLPSAADTPLGA